MSLIHFVITSFFFCCSSCWRIESFTLLSGVADGGRMSDRAWMTCQPNCVLTGLESWPFFRENAVLSNGGTVWPRTIVSLPPFAAELQLEMVHQTRRSYRSLRLLCERACSDSERRQLHPPGPAQYAATDRPR